MTTDNKLIPVVAYERASFDKAKDEHTVEGQHGDNEATAARLGLRIVRHFTDNHKSAAKADLERDEFEAMLRALKAGQLPDGTPVRGAVVTVEDRLIRRTGDYERFVDAITYEDGRVFADARGFKDIYAEDVESMGLIGAVVSRMEVKKTRRRVKNWHRRRAESGKPPMGPRPFGWRDDRVTLDPREAKLVRKAVKEFIAGRSPYAIAREWQKNGVLTSKGNMWTQERVCEMLKRPRNCGYRIIDKQIVTDAHGKPLIGDWEAIITPEQWLAVKAVFEARQRRRAAEQQETDVVVNRDYRDHRYLLTGFLRCGKLREDGTLCLQSLRAREISAGRMAYACRPKGHGGCGGISRRIDKVDETITELVLQRLERLEARRAESEPGNWEAETELADAEKRLRELGVQYTHGKISESLFFTLVPDLEERIKELRKEQERHALAIQQSHADVTDVRRRWTLPPEKGGLDMSQKRSYIREALHTVIIHPARRGDNRFDPDLLEPIWRD